MKTLLISMELAIEFQTKIGKYCSNHSQTMQLDLPHPWTKAVHSSPAK